MSPLVLSSDSDEEYHNLPASEELEFLHMLIKIQVHGFRSTNRTGVDTLNILGMTNTYSLENGNFPLFTTKKMFFRGMAEELLFFIGAKMDSKILEEKNIFFWEGNSNRKFLDNKGLTDYRVGELGPIYGFQWRHFGAKYEGPDADYTGKGVDQLARAIHLLKTNPTARDIIVSAWNPCDLEKSVLPPCHSFFQFLVNGDKLTCLLTQRSGDMALGVPVNVASYALLTHMVAHVTGLKAHSLIHTVNSAHIYLPHIDGVNEMTKRMPKPFPKIRFARKVDNIDDFEYEDFILEGYEPHEKIKFEMF